MSIRTLSAALLAALLLFCPGCAPGPLEEQFFAMDTLVSLQIPGGEEGGEEAAVEVRRLLAELERLWSPTLPESEVVALNRGETVTPDPRTAALLQQAAALSARTGGSFHPMMGALVQLWNVGSATRPPASGAVEALLPLADPACLTLSEDGSLTLPEGAGLDLGGIAKGAAGDLAEALLEEHGIGSALLTLGGQVICCGTPDDDWRIALRNPDDAAHPRGVLSIAAGSVATSGDYERYFELGGRRYHHILDPVTG
ncbi:MAG: FAD:protein FMN transferase, partial [Clostridia bacterium]|nr:FAD:protein FMN transferase [Clostridia bacterium]